MSFSAGFVVGIYGVSGCGKSFALGDIQKIRPEWRCLEGSQVIRDILHQQGQDLEYFQKQMADNEKEEIRRRATECLRTKPGVTLVAGHCSFPVMQQEGSDVSSFEVVFSQGDGETYDAIFYLDKPAELIVQQRQKDEHRGRRNLSVRTLTSWIEHEKAVLKQKCKDHRIYFEVVTHENNDIDHFHERLVDRIVGNVMSPVVANAREQSEAALRRAIEDDIPEADTFLLVDGDRTFTPEDTGKLFFNFLDTNQSDPLSQILGRSRNYSWLAFWEVAMLYSSVPRSEYLRISKKLGEQTVPIYDQWKRFLRGIPENVQPVLVSSSNREIWQAVLSSATDDLDSEARSGLHRMRLIAGNNVALHSYVVDDKAKAIVVDELRKRNGGCLVIAFGDSALDVPMMKASDRAYVVVDSKRNRSMKSFFDEAQRGRRNGWLHQLIEMMPDGVASYSHDGITVGSLDGLLNELTSGGIYSVQDFSLSNTSASILASQTRRADLRGPDLQRVHEQVGMYLADRLLDDHGHRGGFVCDADFSHVQGGLFTGKAPAFDRVLILPLMRGGEPMARGVYQRLPDANFIHYGDKAPVEEDDAGLLSQLMRDYHTNETVNLIIVDSVINSGGSIRRAIQNIRQQMLAANPSLNFCLYVMAAVMQEGAATNLPLEFPRVRFLTMRVSKNSYVGRGGTDTGNRLFGTQPAKK